MVVEALIGSMMHITRVNSRYDVPNDRPGLGIDVDDVPPLSMEIGSGNGPWDTLAACTQARWLSCIPMITHR